MIDAADLLFLRRAVELARHGLYSVTGNPRVGCVVVRDGAVIGRGWHPRAGACHAEVEAIAAAGGDVRGATVYVSLEPCCHTGRQPPCTEALIRGGATRVVAAMSDPDPRVAGRGYQALRDAGVEVDSVELLEARALNAGYINRVTAGRPLVRVKLAASLDGRTAMADGESRWITSEAARADVQYWRARSSAIITGIGTVLADDPALTVRDSRFATRGALRQPLVAIADRRCRTPASAKLFAGDRRVLIFAAADAPDHARAEVVKHPGAVVELAGMLERLAAEGCNEVLVEAGATLAGAFFRERLWDEAVVYLAPRLLGHGAAPMAKLAVDRLADATVAAIGGVKTIGADLRVVLQPTPTPIRA